MASKPYPPDVVKQAQEVLTAWQQIDAGVAVGALNPELLEVDIVKANTLEPEMARLEAQLTDMRNQRDAIHTAIWDKLKRVRSGIKAIYGDDSSQYEMVGGTRASERKPRARKTVTA